MIAFPAGVRVWLATGHTDMRRGFDGLALLVQEQLKRDPHSGQLFVFRGRRGGLIKILWHDGQGMCLFANGRRAGRLRSKASTLIAEATAAAAANSACACACDASASRSAS
jgi:transposase